MHAVLCWEIFQGTLAVPQVLCARYNGQGKEEPAPETSLASDV